MSLIQTSEKVYELLKKSATLEMQEMLMKLRGEALDLQSENMGLNTQIIELREKVKELEEKLRTHEHLEFDGSVYWLAHGDGSKEGPFCQRCHDVDGKLVRLQYWGELAHSKQENYICSACDKMFEKKQ